MTSEQELTPRDKQEVQGDEQVKAGRYYVPDVDIVETADALFLRVDMPGVDPAKVSVELEEGVLTIMGDVSVDDYAGLTPIYSEYRVGNFLRRFNMPNSSRFDPQGITAKMVDGVLDVQIPRAESAKARRVRVQAG